MMQKQYPKVLLMVIVVVALIVRLIAIYPGHPPNHPDEPFTYDRVSAVVIHDVAPGTTVVGIPATRILPHKT